MYRMREKALSLINGGHDESYALLPAYVEMIKETNLGSYVICAWTVMNTPKKPLQFKSLFVSFNAQFRGLIEGCRSLIGVDGTHLKGNHGGGLLSAIAVDGNNEIFLVAVGVVEAENKENLSNFFWHLKQMLSESGREDWTIISDRQKELSQHWTKYGLHFTEGFVQDICVKTSKKTTLGFLRINCSGKLLMLTPILFSKKHLIPWFSMEVIVVADGIRRISMVRHATRQHVAESWPDDGICPNIRDRLGVLKKESRFCEAFSSSAKACYEVRDGRTYLPVSLTNRTCKCGQWQINGIPCKHAIRAIITANRKPEAYVSDWFSVARYKAACGLSILSIPDSEQ
ncbi:uncharacterized protein LOC141651452 [Silene latifolia]|uniref:uncharacterized protein LOC141651452 n=1 Tax=Silene latifolia TaxID=37657 RepID=UPI003D772651